MVNSQSQILAAVVWITIIAALSKGWLGNTATFVRRATGNIRPSMSDKLGATVTPEFEAEVEAYRQEYGLSEAAVIAHLRTGRPLSSLAGGAG